MYALVDDHIPRARYRDKDRKISRGIIWKKRSAPPVGSELGNKSWPQILQAATPVTSAANAKKGPCQVVSVS